MYSNLIPIYNKKNILTRSIFTVQYYTVEHFNKCYSCFSNMVKGTRYRKAYKAKKLFPRLTPDKKQNYKELLRFGYGMSTDEYNMIMFKLIQWSQAEFPGEIAIEVKTRTASKNGENKTT